jgi:hypothetical protein
MTLEEMTTVANSYTDENLRNSQTMAYANEGISIVNADIGTNLPFISEVASDYVALSETWIRQVIIPYMCYSIKLNDSAVQEAGIYINSFEKGLVRINNKRDSAIPVEYQGADFASSHTIDYGDVGGAYNIPVERYSVAEWIEFKEYFRGEFVTYEGLIYQALTNSTGQTPNTVDSGYWRKVG